MTHQRDFQPLLRTTASSSSSSPLFLVLRNNGNDNGLKKKKKKKNRVLEIVGSDVSVSVGVSAGVSAGEGVSETCLSFDHRLGSLPEYDGDVVTANGALPPDNEAERQVVTAAAFVDAEGSPEVRFWVRN